MQFYNKKTAIFLTAILPLVTSVTSHAEIYKSVTPDGRVVYTDNADNAYRASQDTSKITVLDKLTSVTPQATTTVPVTVADNADNSVALQPTAVQSAPPMPQANEAAIPTESNRPSPSQKGDYRLTIIKPEREMSYRRVSQPIEVEVATSQSLKAGDRFVYAINGKHIATTADNKISIPTDSYNPEKYTLTVKIENIKGEVIASSSQTLYILANNIVMQQKKRAAAEAKAAYDKLPWYKKLKININL